MGFARWDAPRLVEGFRSVAGDEVAAIARRSYAGEQVTDAQWARVFAAFGRHLPDAERRLTRRRTWTSIPAGWISSAGSTSWTSSASVASPTLVCVGALDPVTPVDAAVEIVDALPEGLGRLEVIDGAGHFTWMDAPERFWPMIVEFIAG